MEKAIKYCYKIIADGEKNQDAYWFHTHTRLSLNLVRTNRANEAMQFHKDWLEREPNNYLACTSVAFAYDFAGNAETAYEYIKKAEKMQSCELNIVGAEIYTGAGDICRNLKKYDEAIAYWDKAYEADTGSISCLFSKAGAYEETKEFAKAIETYKCIKDWLTRQGYDIAEQEYPNQKIKELNGKL
jgi:tetratricopeptide (TPR) repeat protein